MRFMQRRFAVDTRYGGGFVQSIEGLAGDSGAKVDWFYYVNGIEASEGAAARKVAPGDQIWWDRHDWSATMRVPAVVGSFPEPFVSGSGGKKLPVRLDCAPQSGRVCDEGGQAPAGGRRQGGSQAAIGQTSGVGCAARRGRAVDRGAPRPPSRSCSRRARRCPACTRARTARRSDLLDEKGAVRAHRRRRGRAGRRDAPFSDQQPTWVVTGTDDAGVAAAAAALDAGVLGSRFRRRRRARRRRRPPAHERAVTYRRRASPLHAAARSPAARGAWQSVPPRSRSTTRSCCWCCWRRSWALPRRPVLPARWRARPRGGWPFALVIWALNPLVSHNGLTVLLRLGKLPVLGKVDVTLEATVTAACSHCRRSC